MRAARLVPLLMAAVLSSGGCATTNKLARSAWNTSMDTIAPERRAAMRWDESASAAQVFISTDAPEIFGEPPPVPDTLRRNVEAVANRVANAIGKTIDVSIWDCEAPVAFSTSSGRVVLCRGLLSEIEYEDELAFVIAHEAGHIQLSHLTLLADLENRESGQWLYEVEMSGTFRALFAVGVGAVAGKFADALSDRIEDGMNLTEEEDEDNDVDTVLVGAALLGSYYVADNVRNQVMALLNLRRRAARRVAADGAMSRAPAQEFEADAFALRALKRAGYAAESGEFFLSKLAGRGGNASMAGSARWDYFTPLYAHPETDQRIRKLAELHGDETAEPTAFAPCAIAASAEDQTCLAWQDAVRRADKSVDVLADAAVALAENRPADNARHCEAGFATLKTASVILGADRSMAATAGSFSLVCPGQGWGEIALLPTRGRAGGGYHYLRQLSGILWLQGRPGEAYDVTFFLADLAGQNALAYSDYAPLIAGLGLSEVAREARQRCQTAADWVWVSEQGRFCDDKAPVALVKSSDARRSSGLPVGKKLVLLSEVKVLPEVIGSLDEERGFQLVQAILQNSVTLGPAVPRADKRCLWRSRNNMQLPSARSLVWYNPDPDCIALPARSPPQQVAVKQVAPQ